MLKKITTVALAVFMIIIITGCSSGNLKYDMNLGYDLNNVKYNDITFNIYHCNSNNNSWERIASFPCTPQAGHYNDVKLECEPNHINVVLKDNTYTESEDGNSATYDGTVEATYEFKIDGFNGLLPGWKYFDIKNIEGEQLVRLYPISNNGAVSFLEDIALDVPYDLNGVTNTMDNILITIVMK